VKRLDRLFAVLVLLQGRRRVRARDLAHRLEVSERTIYRDVAALSEAGVPVVALPGAGYELAEGFFLPPLVFTPAEASALTLGARLLAVQAAGRVPDDAQGALEKLAAVLPAATRREVDRLTEVIDLTSRRRPFDLDDPRLAALQESVRARRVVRLRYHAFGSGQVTEREVEPRRLQYAGGAWYLNAYCRTRRGERAFRLERIDAYELLSETFAPREDGAGAAPDRRAREPAQVRVRFEAAAVRWVREWQHQGLEAEEPADAAGAVVMRYAVEAPLEMRPWLLGWGAAAEVLAPPALRAALRDEALRLAAKLAPPDPAGHGDAPAHGRGGEAGRRLAASEE
jgi:predicted DNA-binding transcriptional regulator YafY